MVDIKAHPVCHVLSTPGQERRRLEADEVEGVAPWVLLGGHPDYAEEVGHVVVKKRATSLDVNDVRRRLSLPKARGSAVVLLTRVGDDPWAYVCDPA